MKQISLLFAFILCLSGISKAQKTFILDAKIKKLNTGKVYVHRHLPNIKTWYTDTLEIKNGRFNFTTNFRDPYLVSFLIKSEEIGDNQFLNFSVFTSDTKCKFMADLKKFKDYNITNNRNHDVYTDILEKNKELLKSYNSLPYKISKAYKSGDTALIKKLGVRKDSLALEILNSFITDDDLNNSEVICYLLHDYYIGANLSIKEQILSEISPNYSNNLFINNLREEALRQEKVKIGSEAPHFEAFDTEGNKYQLNEYKGHWVLLEFSASWCGWCKKEIPYLKEIYDKTKNNDFIIFTINLDKDKKAWEKEVKEAQLPWKVISDGKAFEGIGKDYNIHGIPEIILINPDGIIKYKGLRGNDMIRTVEDICRSR